MKDFMEEARELVNDLADSVLEKVGDATKYVAERKEACEKQEEYEAALVKLDDLFCEYGRLVFTGEATYGETKEELETKLNRTVEYVEKLKENLTKEEAKCECDCECDCGENCDCKTNDTFCTQCGAKLKADSLFCGKCGKEVN